MTETDIIIARSLVECRAFRFLPGMLVVRHATPAVWSRLLHRADAALLWHTGDGIVTDKMKALEHWLPDVSDTLTALGVLHLVRVAWGDPYISVTFEPEDAHWYVYGRENDGPMLGHADTEIKALTAALEAAP